MNQYVTGAVIKQLREKNHMTQAELAGKLNISANMLRSKFYVCPVCGNILHSMGEASISCHGIMLFPLEAEPANDMHSVKIEKVEDEYFVTVNHEMTKNHYISFIAAASSDRIQIVKLYPEGNAQARFKISGVREILYYCNRDGLFRISVNHK